MAYITLFVYILLQARVSDNKKISARAPIKWLNFIAFHLTMAITKV